MPIVTQTSRKLQNSASIQGKPTLIACTGKITIVNPGVSSKDKLPKAVENKSVQVTVKGTGHLGYNTGWEDTEGNHTHSAIHLPIEQKPQTRGLGEYGLSSSAPPTPQRLIPMKNGKQEVQPNITLGRNWRKFPEDMSQRDTLQNSYGNEKGLNPNRQFKLLEERENQATIQAIEEKLNKTEPTLIPSSSQGVDKTNSLVASHHLGTRRLVAKSHYYLKSKVVPRRRQG
ncbi:hypothetical protein O181_039213 [Austropuccinia psidii MF-1]|uniref:Uncharacterized protein n=1 Tax=Austropuccinia psidii MF-1 TaxID=1389203 RepID=A0A9Q3DEX3_9BASI|nr:hypothetical protein [Austropuccinia psidii MF-1]